MKTTSFGFAACARAGGSAGSVRRSRSAIAVLFMRSVEIDWLTAQHGQVTHDGHVHIVYGAADGVPAWRQCFGEEAGAVGDVDHRVRRERQRDDGQRLPWIAQ